MDISPSKVAELAAYAISWCTECELIHLNAGNGAMALEFQQSREEYERILDAALDAEVAA